MFGKDDSAIILNLQTRLTNRAKEKFGSKEAVNMAEQLMAVAGGTISITQTAIRVETKDSDGKPLLCYELDDASGEWRQGRLINHETKTISNLKFRSHKPAVNSWLISQDDQEELHIFLQNGLLIKAARPFDFDLSPAEIKFFWGDIFWLQPEEDENKYWDQLSRFGIPQEVKIINALTETPLAEMQITSIKRGNVNKLDLDDYQKPENLPLQGNEQTDLSPLGIETYASTAGSGEHIGWIISPDIIKEIQKLVNEVLKSCGEFNKLNSKGGLVIDWYERAAQSLGVKNLNAFTRLREVLKSAVALHILPGTVNDGQIPEEMDIVYGQWLKNIFADKKIKTGQRWCTFLNGLKKEAPEFGGKQPTESDHFAYRQKILLELVNTVIQERYASPVIDRPKPYHYSCWAFNFDAKNFKMKLKPGSALLKSLAVTSQGLQLDINIEKVRVDFEYEVEPSGSAENVLLCIATIGAANIVEIQFGNANVVAKDILLSLELIPTQVGNQIKLKAKLGSSSHADLNYFFSGSNIFSLGMTELLSAIFSLANAFEGTLLDTVAEGLEDFINDLNLGFPSLFNFEDAPAPVLDQAVLVSNPGKAQLIGATLKLPDERAATPMPSMVMPECQTDFAITLASDYLNGVMAYRMKNHKTTAKPLYFDWKTHLSGNSLPDVPLPAGYEPPQEGGKYPSDFQYIHEEWTLGMPVFKSIKTTTDPNLKDPVGKITIPITYRLVRTHYAWGGVVHKPLVAPDWWWKGLKGPIGPGPIMKDGLLIDLDDIMTLRYGMYRQADGLIISEAPSFLKLEEKPHINPSPGWHAVDVGGIIVDWYTYPIATEEHINVQLEATLPAHINLTESLSFLPGLDLTYGALQVAQTKASFSASFPGLQNQPNLFPKLVENYLKVFVNKHPFTQTFSHMYANIWPLCGNNYMAFGPKETILGLIATIDTMISPTDAQKLQIKADTSRIKIEFGFMEQFAG